MTRFLRRQGLGALIRGSGLLGMVVANLLAPLILGAEQYGISASLVAIPLAVQGLLEPAITALTIRWAGPASSDWDSRMAALRTRSIGFVCAGIAALLLYTSYTLSGLPASEIWLLNGTTAVFLVAHIAHTHLMALAYAAEQHKALLWASCTGGLAYPASLVLLGDLGPRGFVLSLCVWQCVSIFSYLAFNGMRTQAIQLCRVASAEVRMEWKTEYLPAIAPRLTVVLLNSATVIAAAFVMSSEGVAGFKVTLTLIGLAKFLLPVSPEMLQVALSDSGKEREAESAMASKFLIAVFCAACVLSAGMYAIGDDVRSWLVGPLEGANAFDVMFLGMPFFFFISPLSAYLFAARSAKPLLVGFGVSTCCILLGLFTGDLALAFTMGSIAYIVAALAAHADKRLLRKTARRIASRWSTGAGQRATPPPLPSGSAPRGPA